MTIEPMEIVEKFEQTDIALIFDENGDFYISPVVVALALDYSRPKVSANDILTRNAEHFKDKIKPFPLSHGATPEMVLSEEGLYLFLMFSQQPKAKEFKVWAAEQLKKHRLSQSINVFSLDQVIETAQLIIHVATQQKYQQKHITDLQNQQDLLQEQQQLLIEELVNITKAQKHEIQAKVKALVLFTQEKYPTLSTRKLFSTFYGVLKDWFQIPKYEDLPRNKYEKANKLLLCIQQLVDLNLLDFNEYLEVEEIQRLCNSYGRGNT